MSKKGTLGFPRAHRLLSRDDFSRVFGHAQKIASGPFVILAHPNDKGVARLGIVLSKKKIPKAVQRNRIRRLLREHFRKQTIVSGFDLVVLPKHGIDAMTNDELKQRLQKQWLHCKALVSNS